MRWFGGYIGTDVNAAHPRPVGARMLWEGLFPFWLVGHWPDHEVQTLRLDHRRIAVVGPCGAVDISVLATGRVSDTVTTHPGAYTVIEAGQAGLVISTDLGGACPIYATGLGDATVWGSSARALAELTGAGIDTGWLAATLAYPAVPGCGSRSPFEKVTALRPGARITLRPGHGPQASPLRFIRPDCRQAAAQRLRRALDGGVAVRVGPTHRPTSDLSGGLDSTSLCLLAGRHVQPSGTITAMTVHPAGQHTGGDLDYARAAARHSAGRIEHVLLALTAEHLPYAGLDRVPATDEPAPSTVTYARLAAQFALLADLGSDCHLTGDGGDTLLHPHPAYLADLAWSGRWLRLAAHSQGWARLQRTSPWTLASRCVRSGGRPATPPGWMTAHALELATLDSDRRGRARPDANTQALREIQTVGRTARADAQLAETFGLALHNPYIDSSVIAAALSVPAWQREDPWHYKPLLTAAVGDLLPLAIARRVTKGAFDADHYRGLRAHLPAVLDLAGGRLAELGLVDPQRLRSALWHAAVGLPAPFGLLEPVITTEVWLHSLADARPTEWVIGPRPEATGGDHEPVPVHRCP